MNIGLQLKTHEKPTGIWEIPWVFDSDLTMESYSTNISDLSSKNVSTDCNVDQERGDHSWDGERHQHTFEWEVCKPSFSLAWISHFIFYPPYLCSVMPILYRSFSCTPRNPSLHPFQIPFPENLHLSMLNELWMVLYNQEKSTSLISSPWHSKSRFPPYESWFKDVTTGTPHLDAKVVGFLSMWIGNQQNRVGSLLTS